MLNANTQGCIDTARILMKETKRKSKFGRLSLATLAEEALRKAVARAIADHRRTGDPIAVLRNGKAVSIAADQAKIFEPGVACKTRPKKINKPPSKRKK